MKKILFYTSIIISIVLFINVIQILSTDYDRLTEYGFGYLTGKIILIIIFMILAFFIRDRKPQI